MSETFRAYKIGLRRKASQRRTPPDAWYKMTMNLPSWMGQWDAGEFSHGLRVFRGDEPVAQIGIGEPYRGHEVSELTQGAGVGDLQAHNKVQNALLANWLQENGFTTPATQTNDQVRGLRGITFYHPEDPELSAKPFFLNRSAREYFQRQFDTGDADIPDPDQNDVPHIPPTRKQLPRFPNGPQMPPGTFS